MLDSEEEDAPRKQSGVAERSEMDEDEEMFGLFAEAASDWGETEETNHAKPPDSAPVRRTKRRPKAQSTGKKPVLP